MGINFDNLIGNPRLYKVSRELPGTESTQKKGVGEQVSFLDLLKKISDSPGSPGIVSDQSQSVMELQKAQTAQTALVLCQKMELQMNESVLRMMADTKGENSFENSLMDDLGDILSKGKTGEPLLSKIRQAPSENDLSQIQLLDQSIKTTAETHEETHEKIQGENNGFHGIDRIIGKASAAFGVDSELIRKVIQAESDFNSNAISSKGAMGLMQLMPKTATELGVIDPLNPEENVMGGTRYLKKLLDRYDGNVPLALAAYNWGMGNLDSNRTMPSETRNYVAKITGIALT